MSKHDQKPFSNQNIEHSKPQVNKTRPVVLKGSIGNSMNGGHNRTIAYKKVMAGEKHKQYNMRIQVKLLTPLTPNFQRLKLTVRSYFVPNSRVWLNAEAFTAQNPTNAARPDEYPNLGGMVLPLAGIQQMADTPSAGTRWGFVPITQTTFWRDAFISSYVPRLGAGQVRNISAPDADYLHFPKINALPLRGRVAIYNDFERNKEYDPIIEEYKGNYVTAQEMNNYLPVQSDGYTMDKEYWFPKETEGASQGKNADYYQMRAKKDNSYYTDYRTNAQGFDTAEGTPTFETNGLVNWAEWEALIAEARSQAENAQLNDWDIISKIRGSKTLTEGKVQLIGQKTYPLAYNSITQTSYNSNADVKEEFQAMGTQGAYSYTELNVPCYAGFEFNEEGFVHIIATVSADTVYESGIERTLMNVRWDEQYRPDMQGQKLDVLYAGELGTDYSLEQLANIEQEMTKVIGYKRKHSELFKLPNVIAGDLTNDDWYNESHDGGASDTYSLPRYGTPLTSDVVIPQYTFQFFEKSAKNDYLVKGGSSDGQMNPEISATNEEGKDWWGKRLWKDYTDLEINRNLAYMAKTVSANTHSSSSEYGTYAIYVGGNSQIFLGGECECEAILPVNEDILNNFTNWGEH